jgi:hypothetical protein
MGAIRDIQTNQEDVACDVCGRTLLRGEHPEPFLAGGTRRLVCDLCTLRAEHEGWIREDLADDLSLRDTRHERRRPLLERFRARRRASAPAPEPRWPGSEEPQAAPAAVAAGRVEPDLEPEVARDPTPTPVPVPAEPAPPRRPRHVRAVPTNADLKVARALEVFNGSQHTRTVAGVSRSLGAPAVSARPLADRPSVVSITVMWELSWYRFEVDLSDEGLGVHRVAQGDELSELPPEEQRANAGADERGGLHVVSPPA